MQEVGGILDGSTKLPTRERGLVGPNLSSQAWNEMQPHRSHVSTQLNKKILEITLPKFLTHKNRNKSCSMPQTVKMVYT